MTRAHYATISMVLCRKKGLAALVLEWEAYLKLFKNVQNETAIGEASVCYLWSETAAWNIRQRVPGAKIIMRSEERRVGKECRSRWSPYDEKKEGKEREQGV